MGSKIGDAQEPKLVIFDIVEDAKDHQEKVDEVKVEADCTHDVLIGAESLGNKESIEYYVSTEQDASEESIDQVHRSAKWNEYSNKAGHKQGNQTAEKVGTHAGEVVLGLQGEQCESQKYAKGDE